MLKRLRQNEKGLVEGIFAVVVIFMVVMGIFTVRSQAKTVSVKNELQGIVDNAAIGALVKSVDDTVVMDEGFRVDASAVRANFEEIFERAMAETSDNLIANTRIRRFHVHTVDVTDKNTAIGDNRQEGGRYQAYLDVAVAADYPTHNIFEAGRPSRVRFHNILTGADEEITDNPPTRNSGTVVVRSLERVVLR